MYFNGSADDYLIIFTIRNHENTAKTLQISSYLYYTTISFIFYSDTYSKAKCCCSFPEIAAKATQVNILGKVSFHIFS